MTSFQYSQRPAKYVERRMLVELCQRLSTIAPLKTYQYVGFGALEFVDFVLMHRDLSITHMVSIESNTNAAKRYEFNKPYRSIDLRLGWAHEHLPLLDWSKLSIVWLDYESQLIEQCVRDIETVGRLCRPGSVIIVTVQAAALRGERLKMLEKNLPASRLPLGLTEESLEGPWTFADVQYNIVGPALGNVVRLRPDEAHVEQLVNFHYADGAQMQTVAWIVNSPEVAPRVAACMFDDLLFVSRRDARLLEVPVLTRKELAHLNALLPLKPRGRLSQTWLTDVVQSQYAEIYRYYPSYVAVS